MADNLTEWRYIQTQDSLYINRVADRESPEHLVITGLLGLVPKPFILDILYENASIKQIRMKENYGQIVGGYCRLLPDEEPPKYEFTRPAGTINPGTAEQFDHAQARGSIQFTEFTNQEAQRQRFI